MRLFFTGASKGDEPQPSPSLSLGGYVSSSPLPNGAINNLFGSISQYGKELKSKEVRAIVLKNETLAITNPTLFYDNVSEEPITNYRFAFVTLAEDECGWYMERISQGDSLPINATFIDPRTESNAVSLGAIPVGGYMGIWVERTYNVAGINTADSCENLLAKFDLADVYQISSIQFPADASDSLNDTYFLFDTLNESYAIWYDTGAGTAPEVTGKNLIKVSISTDDTAADVAAKTLAQMNIVISSRGEIALAIETDTITVTSNLYGPFPIPVNVDAGVTPTLITLGVNKVTESVEDMQLTISY